MDPKKGSVWIAEGLIQYLKDEQVENLLSLIAGASAPGSTLLILPGKKLIKSNLETSKSYKLLESFGAGYAFSGTDSQQSWLKARL